MIGSQWLLRARRRAALFDQQPIEAQAVVRRWRASRLTTASRRDPRWPARSTGFGLVRREERPRPSVVRSAPTGRLPRRRCRSIVPVQNEGASSTLGVPLVARKCPASRGVSLHAFRQAAAQRTLLSTRLPRQPSMRVRSTKPGKAAMGIVVKRTNIVIRPGTRQRGSVPNRSRPPARARLSCILGARRGGDFEGEVEALSSEIVVRVPRRHQRLTAFFLHRFEQVKRHMLTDTPVSETRKLLIGAYFLKSTRSDPRRSPARRSSGTPRKTSYPTARGASSSACATGEGHISLTARA